MEAIKTKYPDLISLTRFYPIHEVIDFEKFIGRHFGMENFFVPGNEIGSVRQIFRNRKITEQTCFTEFGHTETILYTNMRYYQAEVGISGPMHTPIDEPVNILLLNQNYILWNGYHRSIIKIMNGELSIKGYVFELVI